LMNALAERVESYRVLAVTTNRTELTLSSGFNFCFQVCVANAVVTDKFEIVFYFCQHM
jgi:hypothetical protein